MSAKTTTNERQRAVTAYLKKQVLVPVAEHLKSRMDSLASYRQFGNSGIEGWLKVEVVSALRGKVIQVRGKGADLLLKNQIELELKAETTMHRPWIRSGVLQHPGAVCLLLANEGNEEKIRSIVLQRKVVLLRKVGHDCKKLCISSLARRICEPHSKTPENRRFDGIVRNRMLPHV